MKRLSFNRLFPGWLLATVLSISCACAAAMTPRQPSMELWRLECGEMQVDDIHYFSDAFHYRGPALVSNGCYLIRRDQEYFLWEAGLPVELLGDGRLSGGWHNSLKISLADQLAILGLEISDVTRFAVSHFHGDHIGQAAQFSHATLYMNERDVAWIKEHPTSGAWRRLSPWFEGNSAIEEIENDLDVFGDGSVTILATPGHTPGHSSLLVRLPETGPVLLSGDLYHFRSEIGKRIVSRWNTSRADTLASNERFEAIMSNLDPLIIVQHDPLDISRLPEFPNSAR